MVPAMISIPQYILCTTFALPTRRTSLILKHTHQMQKMMNSQMLIQFLTIFLIIAMDDGHFGPKQTFAMPIPAASSQSVSSKIIEQLKHTKLHGNLSFEKLGGAGKDYGHRFHSRPLAVLYPKSVSDISSTIKLILGMGSSSKITVAAKGHGHSMEGQAQAPGGVVINMESLGKRSEMHFHTGEFPYVDVSGGELWINVLHEGLKHGLAPKSWTDYLYLTIGGTLSNGGISGQAFRFGPQIDNVYQLEVVTGKGQVVTCSDKQNSDLFHGVLGGLGQFGIITKARIAIQPAPKLVKWIRVLYSNFSMLTSDQEYLISTQNTFDYIEGFVKTKKTGLLNNWRSSFNLQDRLQASQFKSEGEIFYSLEVAKYFNPEDRDHTNKTVDALLSKLSYDRSTLLVTEVSYTEFLNRVHDSELKLREKGLWDIPHPWLELIIPRSKIHEFAEEVFGKIITDNGNGPILFYPVNKSKWRNDTSMVIPEEENVIYVVGFLTSAMTNSNGEDGLENLLNRNKRILSFCRRNNLGMKQYMPHYIKQDDWKAHFGNDRWDVFSRRKSIYDPLGILAPGQRIFQKADAFQSE